MSIRFSLVALAAAALASPSASGSGQTAPHQAGDAVLFPTVVISATGYGVTPFQLPLSNAVLTATKLGEQMPRTLPAALEGLPGIMVQKTSSAQGAPYLRGFTGFRTLLLVDGIRLNNSVFREGPNQYWGTIDPLGLERLEILMGPSSVIHGSDAIGGTVNAVSATPPLGERGPRGGGRLFYRYASADDSRTGRVEAHGQHGDRVGAQLGLSRKSYHDLRAGRDTGTQPRTGFTEAGADGAIVYQLGAQSRLTARWQDFAQDDAWRTHSTIFGSTWQGTRPGSDLERSLDQGRRLFALQLHTAGLSGPFEQLDASLSHQRQREHQFRRRADRRTDDTGFAVGTLGASVQAQRRSSLGRWVFGGEAYRDRVDSFSVRYRADGSLQEVDIQGPVADNADYDLAGAYVENRLQRFGPAEVTVGGRYTYAAAEARRVRDPVTGAARRVTADWHSVVGSARSVLHLDPAGRQNLFAGVSEAFRAPNLSDLTRFDIAEGGQIETPAPGLKAEFFVTAEAGWRARGDLWSASVAGFHTVIRNQIIRTPTGARVDGLAEVTKRNSGAGYVHGVELGGSARLAPDWTLSGVATWMEGELDYYPASDSARLLRGPLSRVMPPTGHITLRWEPRASRIWLEFAASAAGRQDRLAPSDRVDTERIPARGTPGYGLGKLRAGWRPGGGLTVTAALDNVTNETYRIHGSGLNEPGRNLVLAADYRF